MIIKEENKNEERQIIIIIRLISEIKIIIIIKNIINTFKKTKHFAK